MNLTKKQLSLLNTVRGWSESDVLTYLEKNNLEEFRPFCEAKSIDGNALLSLSEGVVAMWRPKIDAKKLIAAIEHLKNDHMKNDDNTEPRPKIKPKVPIRTDSLNQSNQDLDKITQEFVIPKDITAPKSFLYCPKMKLFEPKTNPYLPMKRNSDSFIAKVCEIDDNVTSDRGYYEMSTKLQVSKEERAQKRLSMDENSYEELDFSKNSGGKKKTGLLKRIWRQPSLKKDELKMEEAKKQDSKIESNWSLRSKKFPISKINKNGTDNDNVTFKTYKRISDSYIEGNNILHINDSVIEIDNDDELLHNYQQIDTDSFLEMENECYSKENNDFLEIDVEREIYIIEKMVKDDASNDCDTNMNCRRVNMQIDEENYIVNDERYESLKFDIINSYINQNLDDANSQDALEKNNEIDILYSETTYKKPSIMVEEYLEPRKCFNPNSTDIMDSLAEEMIKLFDSNLQTMTIFDEKSGDSNKDSETKNSDDQQTTNKIISSKPPTSKKPVCDQPKSTQKSNTGRIAECQKPFETLHRWNESLRNSVKRKRDVPKVNMSERPLPVPVENEFYYMEIGRQEAECLLEGQPDGTFILRPSSQPNHVYTVTLMYQGRIYNIGCRKRQDGRLALGFSKASEPNFQTIHELIEYYYNEKLVLLVEGKMVGSTLLKRLHP